MQVVLLESIYNSICSQMNVFYQKYPRASRIFLTKNSKPEEVSKCSHPPLINSGWLLVCSGIRSRRMLSALWALPPFNVVIYTARTRAEANLLLQLLDGEGVAHTFIDHLNVPEKDVLDMLQRNLRVGQDMASVIYKRCRGNLRDVTNVMYRLSALWRDVTLADVTACERPAKEFPIYKLSGHLLRQELDSQGALAVISQYRYAPEHLLDYLENCFGDYLYVFQLVHDGMLTAQNAQEVLRGGEFKKLKGMKLFTLQKTIEAYSSISVDYLYFLIHFNRTLPRNTVGLMKLAVLVRSI